MKKRWWILIVTAVVAILAIIINKAYTANYYEKVRPDEMYVYGENGTVVANIGSYSWSSKAVFGQTLHVNACGISPLEMEYKDTVKILQGDTVKIDSAYDITNVVVYKYDGDEISKIENKLEYDKTEIDTSNLEVGMYIIELFAGEGESNDVIYSFKLEIFDSFENKEV